MNGEHGLVCTVRAHNVDGTRDALKIGFKSVASKNVNVDLPEFAESAALGTLVAVHVRNGEPLEREVQLSHLARNHARNGGGHFGTDRKIALAAVGEVVGLLVCNLVTALCGIELQGFEHGTVVFVKGRTFKNVTDDTEEPVAQTHFLRIEVARAFVGLCRKLFTHDLDSFRPIIRKHSYTSSNYSR